MDVNTLVFTLPGLVWVLDGGTSILLSVSLVLKISDTTKDPSQGLVSRVDKTDPFMTNGF